MTDAPDPGLTDLIAAHYRTITTAIIYRDDESDGAHRKGFECVCACGDEYMALTRAGDRTEATVLRRADSAHVALVVEQHTNGRIAELEARIANAQSLCRDTGRYNAARQKHWNIRVFACDVLAALKGRAALEGEQQ